MLIYLETVLRMNLLNLDGVEKLKLNECQNITNISNLNVKDLKIYNCPNLNE